ncbi:bluetail domain-containing putative surface protein [Sphingomonas sp. LT1P40]|uniref:bluetail domain-containing putative surface protein n=1 Tax=Alteristakelama amylovorans TaxID=3096166 RepID=UPI002FC81FA2
MIRTVDLAAAGRTLGAGEAVLFTASSGNMSGRTFVLIDANGVAGYESDEDYVIELVNPLLLVDPPFPFV